MAGILHHHLFVRNRLIGHMDTVRITRWSRHIRFGGLWIHEWSLDGSVGCLLRYDQSTERVWDESRDALVTRRTTHFGQSSDHGR